MKGIIFRNKSIILQKNLNELDKFAIKSAEIIQKFFDYAIVGGYVSILFGRARITEDIDIYISSSNFSLEIMRNFYDTIHKKNLWCFNAINYVDGFNLLKEGFGIRISEKNKVIPNAEVKLAKKPLDFVSIREHIKVKLNEFELLIGPLELNIAYKLYLGSQKDFEDALYLFCIFNEKLDFGKIKSFCKELNVKDEIIERVLRC